MKSMLIYDRVVPLNRHTHRQLRIRHDRRDARFASVLNSVPLATAEFAAAQPEYAIVFARMDDGNYLPAIVVGLQNRQNLYVSGDAQWKRGYVPAFLRQYPFLLAEDRDGGPMTVCVDLAYDGFSEVEGEPLFGDDGQDSPGLSAAMKFLTDYHTELQRTALFTARLKELDLLEPRVIRVARAEGEPQEISGVHVVSEERLQKLEPDVVADLLRSGAIGLIYAHLLSLSNLERLSQLQAEEARAATKN